MAVLKTPYDPQLVEALVTNGGLSPNGPQAAPERVTLKAMGELMSPFNAKFDDLELSDDEITVPDPDGNILEVTIVKPKSTASRPRNGIDFIHGEGLFVGTRHFLLQET